MWWHTPVPTIVESINRRTAVQDGPSKKRDLISKIPNTKQKKTIFRKENNDLRYESINSKKKESKLPL
jgi:hypothetical protein